MNSENNNENCEENIKKKRREIKVPNFIKKIFDYYKNWNGIGRKLIAIVCIISVYVITKNSFRLNRTFASIDKNNYENAMMQISAEVNDMTISGFTYERIKAIVKDWIEINRYDRFFYNYILILASFMLVYFVVGKSKISLIISSIFWILIDIINYVVFKIRGTPLAISDIFSIGTAMSVTEGLKFEPEPRFYRFIGFSILYIVLLVFIKFKKKDKTKKVKNIIKRIVAIIIAIICTSIVLNTKGFRTDSYWNLEERYRLYGLEFSMLRQALDLQIDKPEGYSVAKAKEILSRYNVEDKNKEKTNIIVVMNESFADINRVYNLGLESNIPYFDSLSNKENAIKGTLYSSVYGGGTATAEWEVFTGNSAAYIPLNSVPLILYVNNNKQTIMSDALSQGYQTIAIHPYYQDGYNRLSSYPKLGFNKSIFIENMPDYERKDTFYASDKYTYNKLIKEYENRDKSKNFFGYVLTMQNHLPYTTPNDFYMPDGYVENNEEFDEYLSLVRDSDDALKELIEYFEKQEEKTILLFFGDHHPNVGFEFDEKNIENKWLATQEVPYLLWANFDIEEKQGEDISFNLLSTLLYDYSGLNTNSYIEFLNDFKKEIPVFTAKGYRDKDGKTYEIGEESPYKELINEYKILEYYFMFDYKL